MKDCTARLLIFSGRPDPTWKIEESTMSELLSIWSSLVPITDKNQTHPKLGYRGCRISCSSGFEWFVYRNTVSLTVKGKTDTRNDQIMAFEEGLFESAPPETIPNSLMQIIRNQQK